MSCNCWVCFHNNNLIGKGDFDRFVAYETNVGKMWEQLNQWPMMKDGVNVSSFEIDIKFNYCPLCGGKI